MKPTRSFDLLVLGSGMAGMTAAIFAARANLKTAIVEEKVCGGLANWTHSVENFPGYLSINGMELMERVLDQVQNLGVDVDQAAQVVRLSLEGALKTVETTEYLYTAKAMILATGRQPVTLPVETDSERIHYCSVCDGSAYIGKKVLVVGGGNSGFDGSLYLLSLGVAEIILIEVLDRCCAGETAQSRLRSWGNVEIKTCTRLAAVAREGTGCRVTLENLAGGASESLYIDGLFVFIGQKANTELFRDVVAVDADHYVITGPDRETNIPGVYAAGDVVRKSYRYLTTAMADGTVAALAAEKYIRALRHPGAEKLLSAGHCEEAR